MRRARPVATADLRAAYVTALRRYFARDEVHGIAIGITYRKGTAEAALGVRVHVHEKLPRDTLPAERVLPRRLGTQRLDVTEGHFVDDACTSFGDRISASAFIQPGLSIGRRRGRAGTIGALVTDGQGRRFLLGAGHVLVGDDSNPGDPISQPAEEDGSGQAIARLARYARAYDAALAELDSSRVLRPRALEETRRFAGTGLPFVGQVLRKSSRSTCCTLAKVEAIGAFQGILRAVWLRPVDGEADDARICQGGDSGAIWFDPETMKTVGLHVKGENVLGSRAIAVQLASDPSAHYVGVLDQWGVTVL